MSEQKSRHAHRGKCLSEAEFRKLWLDRTITVAEIARRLDVTDSAVTARARARGLPTRRTVRYTAHKRKITDPQFPELWSAGITLAELARLYHCTTGTVYETAKRLGLPRRNNTRWNAKTLVQWLLAADAQATEAALQRAAMKDKFQQPMQRGGAG